MAGLTCVQTVNSLFIDTGRPRKSVKSKAPAIIPNTCPISLILGVHMIAKRRTFLGILSLNYDCIATETAPVKGRYHRVSVVYLCNNMSGREQGG
jgi:hypothetical protein